MKAFARLALGLAVSSVAVSLTAANPRPAHAQRLDPIERRIEAELIRDEIEQNRRARLRGFGWERRHALLRAKYGYCCELHDSSYPRRPRRLRRQAELQRLIELRLGGFDGRGRGPGLFGREPGLLGRRPGLLGRRPGLLGRRPGLLGRRSGLLGWEPGMLGRGPGTLGRGLDPFASGPGPSGRGPGRFGRGRDELRGGLGPYGQIGLRGNLGRIRSQ